MESPFQDLMLIINIFNDAIYVADNKQGFSQMIHQKEEAVSKGQPLLCYCVFYFSYALCQEWSGNRLLFVFGQQ